MLPAPPSTWYTAGRAVFSFSFESPRFSISRRRACGWQIFRVVVLPQRRRLVVAQAEFAHRVEVRLGERVVRVSNRRNDDGNLQARLLRGRDGSREIARDILGQHVTARRAVQPMAGQPALAAVSAASS